MIVLAIVAIVLIFVGLGTASHYFAFRDEIGQRHEESAQTINLRIKEDLDVAYDETGGTTSEIPYGSEIQGVMIRCEGTGIIHTEQIPDGFGGTAQEYDRMIREMRSRC